MNSPSLHIHAIFHAKWHQWTFRWAVVMIGGLCLSFPSNARAQANGNDDLREIRVATWNLEWFYDHQKGDNASDLAKEQSAPDRENWEWKKNVVAEAISKFKPTILAVQEIENRSVLVELCDILKKKHSLNYRVAYIEGFDTATEQDVAFLYLSGMVEFSRREQTKKQFDSREYYNLSKHLFGRFEWEVGDHTESLVLLNVHYRAKEEAGETRRKQAKLARLWIEPYLQAGENVMLLGDTNFEELCGTQIPGGELEITQGKTNADPKGFLVDLLEKAPEAKRKTHMLLDKQFDRLFASQSLMTDDPSRRDLVFQAIEVLPQVNIRGSGPDLDHWDTRYTKPFPERDISDHFPVMATFQVR